MLSRNNLFFKEIADHFRMFYWWKLRDTSETRAAVKDLSFQLENYEQHDEGTIWGCLL
jgi:hypothetical protein